MSRSRAGLSMALVAMVSVQLGLAVSIGLIDELGASGAAWLRLALAAVVFLAVVRPRPRSYTREALVAAVALGVVAWPRRGPWPRGRTLVYVVGFGALWFGLYNVALNAGEQHVDAGTAALLVQLGPILIAVLAGLLLGEGFPPTLVAGIVVAFSGVALIAVGSGGGGLGGDRLGALLCVAAAALYAAGVLLQKPALAELDGLQATWLGCLVGAVVCLPWAGSLVRDVAAASPAEIAGVAYLGLFPTAIAFTTWAYALRRLGAGRTSATTYLVPAVAVLLSWALLGETPTAVGFAGGALCLVGVAITRLRRRRPTP